MYAADRFQRVHDFLDFCKSKPPREEYHWDIASICACGQFFGNIDWYPKERAIDNATGISLNCLAADGKWTFGALAKRVDRALEVEMAKA